VSGKRARITPCHIHLTNDREPWRHELLQEAPRTSAGDKAARAATATLGGGKVVSVETSDEGRPAVYEVKVAKAGTVIEVQVDDSYDVTATKADDDQHDSDHGDGDGETNDD
jgi:hypothetical protein